MELGQSKATGIRVIEGSQINSSTLLQLLDPQQCLAARLLPYPALPPPQPCPSSLGTGRAALTALLGSSLQHAASGGSRRSWPTPASGSPGCLRRNEKGLGQAPKDTQRTREHLNTRGWEGLTLT